MHEKFMGRTEEVRERGGREGGGEGKGMVWKREWLV